MGLMDLIRKAEEQSRRAARRGMERARATWDETERRLRRKMRVNRPPAEGTRAATAAVHSIAGAARNAPQHESHGSPPRAATPPEQRRRA
jgi:hypothetical protein